MQAGAGAARRDGREGFTLVEVLAAMIILAIGLMGLQSLGIYAARSVTLAQRQSEYALVATRHLEAAVDSIDRSVISGCGVREWPAGINTDVVRRVVAGGAGQRVVTVAVVPDAESAAVRPQLYQLETYVFVPGAAAC
jgi:prepilin-type N-terminal cleavage/methylation domain-containing protein